MGRAIEAIREFSSIAFTLLGILFGMIIMTFIFGQLGPSAGGLDITEVGFNESLQIQNNSLQAIVTYTEGADTQFSTVSIAIILILLIAVFLLFWNIFVTQKKKSGNIGGGSDGGNFG